MFLWAKACNTIVYVQNRSPHRIFGGQDSERGILRSEPRDRTFEDIWLSSLHPCACGKEDEVVAFKTEGYNCGVHRDLKSLQDLHTSETKESCEQRC
jgi:hypothetical protein